MIDTSNERVKRLAADLYGFANAEKRAEAADMLLALVGMIQELKARAEAAAKRVTELEAVLERIANESMDYQYVARAALEAKP